MDLRLILLGQLVLAFLLGGIIGLEREISGHPAGMRTYAIVAIGSCLFGILSVHGQEFLGHEGTIDPTRMAAQVVSGIGFLCAGVIFTDKASTTGLTTAATIWTTASIGLAVAFSIYSIAIAATLLTFSCLWLKNLAVIKKIKEANRRRSLLDHRD